MGWRAYVVNILSFIPVIRIIFKERKYQSIGLNRYLLNIYFQRILRHNASCDFSVHFTSVVTGFRNIIIEDPKSNSSSFKSFASSPNCYYAAANGIIFKKDALWGPGVKFVSSNHNAIDRKQIINNKPIIIGKNVWIGANSVILPGIEIGNNSSVGAGSIVTKNIPENVIAAGNPARIIKQL